MTDRPGMSDFNRRNFKNMRDFKKQQDLDMRRHNRHEASSFDGRDCAGGGSRIDKFFDDKLVKSYSVSNNNKLGGYPSTNTKNNHNKSNNDNLMNDEYYENTRETRRRIREQSIDF